MVTMITDEVDYKMNNEKTTTFRRILALLAAASMLLPLAACTKQPDDASKRPDGDQTVEVDDSNRTTARVLEEFAGHDYDGYNFRVASSEPGGHYYWMLDGDTGYANEIWYPEDSAETQTHSVFMRNVLAEDLLNIKISPLWAGHYYWDLNDVIVPLIKSNSDDFDMVLGAQTRIIPLATEGYFLNLLDFGTLDLTNDWWDAEYLKTFTYKNKYLYSICGDYNIFDDYSLAALFYNKALIENYNLGDPADLVDEGTWTIDAMMQLADAVTGDTDGDGYMTESDTYGIFDNQFSLTHFMEGCDIQMTEPDEDGVPQLIIEREQFINSVQYVFEKVRTSPSLYIEIENAHGKEAFMEDKILFLYEQLGGINMLRDMESDFSLLPLPKKDNDQRDYTSIANGIWLTVLSVPITSRDVDRTGVIMDVLGGMSTDTVNAALYEVTLGPKLFREQRTKDMLTYVIDSARYDWAKELKWAYPIYTVLSEQTGERGFTLASSVQKQIKILKSQLKHFLVGLER